MARAKRKKDARVARASRAMTLTPPINPGVMESRVLGHVKLMKDLLDRGLSFRSVPVNVIKTIVQDFQIAGLPVPPSALQLVHEHTQETPPRRPAPIWMDPLKMRSIRGDDQPELPYAPMDTREAAIANNINPKTGYPGYGGAAAVAAAMPSVTGGAKLFTTNNDIPYTPQYRYTKPLGFGQWLPPWMVSGDQPNQFVKTPPRPVRPMGVGVRPGYRATDQMSRPGQGMLPVDIPNRAYRAADQILRPTGGQGVLPGYIPNRVMLPQVPDPSQLPYTRRPIGEAAAIARYGGAGPAIAAAEAMNNPPPIPDRARRPVLKRPLDLEDFQPIPVPGDNAAPVVPDRPKRRQNAARELANAGIAAAALADPMEQKRERRRPTIYPDLANETKRLVQAAAFSPSRHRAKANAKEQLSHSAKEAQQVPLPIVLGSRGIRAPRDTSFGMVPLEDYANTPSYSVQADNSSPFGQVVVRSPDSRQASGTPSVTLRQRRPAAKKPAAAAAKKPAAAIDLSPEGSPVKSDLNDAIADLEDLDAELEDERIERSVQRTLQHRTRQRGNPLPPKPSSPPGRAPPTKNPLGPSKLRRK